VYVLEIGKQMQIEFREWAKIPRLFRDVTVTEKIDGTNSAIGIQQYSASSMYAALPFPDNAKRIESDFGRVTTLVYAQSRKRIITPGKDDNHGFAGWVWMHADELADGLGPGLHFGEWWGSGIQRGYGLKQDDKRFSLFNTKRWAGPEMAYLNDFVPGLGVVPVLYEGPFSEWHVHQALADLDEYGSRAVHGFKPAEGVVVYHHAGNTMFKATILNDEAPKAATTGSVSVEPLPDVVQAIYGTEIIPETVGVELPYDEL
jgi:hypothetical protein